MNGLTDTAAVLSGAVNPNGSGPTSWRIEYGVGGFTTLAAAGTLPDGTSAVPVSARVIDMKPSTGYVFRVVATSAGGAVASATAGFSTLPTPVSPPPAPPVTPPGGEPSTNPQARIASVRIRVRPRRDRRAPFRYRVSGRARTSDDARCAGKVRIRFERGDRQVAGVTMRLGSDCTFQRRLRVPTRRLNDDGGRLRVSARALGTANLSARSSNSVRVRYG